MNVLDTSNELDFLPFEKWFQTVCDNNRRCDIPKCWLLRHTRCIVNMSWYKSIVIGARLNFFASRSFVRKIIRTFASHLTKVPVLIKSGALDERFSLWSAKPAKAVRLRHAPHRKALSLLDSTLIFLKHFCSLFSLLSWLIFLLTSANCFFQELENLRLFLN